MFLQLAWRVLPVTLTVLASHELTKFSAGAAGKGAAAAKASRPVMGRSLIVDQVVSTAIIRWSPKTRAW